MRAIWTALVLISILNYSHKMKSEKAYNPSKKNPQRSIDKKHSGDGIQKFFRISLTSC